MDDEGSVVYSSTFSEIVLKEASKERDFQWADIRDRHSRPWKNWNDMSRENGLLHSNRSSIQELEELILEDELYKFKLHLSCTIRGISKLKRARSKYAI